MSESAGISAHGTIIKMGNTPVGELRDITPPALSRKAIETTTHNSDDDSYVAGHRRKGEMQLQVNFLPSGDQTLMDSWAAGTKEKWELDYPDGGVWVFSGFVSNIGPKAPVDGALEASVSIRPSGGHVFTP